MYGKIKLSKGGGQFAIVSPYQYTGGINVSEKEVSLIRVNTRIGHTQNEWLNEESKQTGVSKSAIMQMALEQYMTQKEALKAMKDMTALYEKMDSIENELKELRK